jgi:hypothetical protein
MLIRVEQLQSSPPPPHTHTQDSHHPYARIDRTKQLDLTLNNVARMALVTLPWNQLRVNAVAHRDAGATAVGGTLKQ